MDPTLAERYQGLAEATAAKMTTRLPAYVDRGDIRGASHVGLMRAVTRSDRTKGLGSFVMIHVRAAVLEELRAMDPLSPYSRSRTRKIKTATESLRQKLSREPTQEEIRHELDLSPSQWRYWKRIEAATHQISLDRQETDQSNALRDSLPDANSPDARAQTERRERLMWLAERMEKLPRRDREIMMRYYFDGANQKTIAAEQGLSTVSISTIITSTVRKLQLAAPRR